MADQVAFIAPDDATKETEIPAGSVALVYPPTEQEPKQVDTRQIGRVIGEIIMWAFNPDIVPIPAGWAKCDGGTYNGVQTVDMSGLFPVCVGNNNNPNSREADNNAYQLLASGGINKYALNVDEMPSHAHALDVEWTQTDYGGEWTGKIPAANQNVKWNTNSVGGGQAHENRPAYRALQFIMFVGLPATTA